MPEWMSLMIVAGWALVGVGVVFLLFAIGSMLHDRFVRGNKDAFKTDPRYLTHRRKHDDPLPRH